jgi:hypothetical protein
MNDGRVVLGIGLAAFAALSAVCIWRYAPLISAEMRSRAAAEAKSAPSSALVLPSLKASLAGGQVVLEGLLPDAAAKARALARARESFGAGKFADRVQVQEGLWSPGAGWLPTALSLLPLAARAGEGGGVEVRGHRVTLSGRVSAAGDKARLLEDAAKLLGPAFTLNDRVAVGDAQGGGPAPSRARAGQ